MFCQLDYDEWLLSKMKSIPRAQTIQADYLFDCQLGIFMEQDGQLLRSFLQIGPKKMKVRLDSDYDDSSLLSDQVESMYSSSLLSADNKSVNSSCDNISFNNIHAINVVHHDYNPTSILGKVLIRKNANWEIFKLLSQSKMDKIKNKIRVNPNEKSNLRENLIDARIKTIRKTAAEALEFGRSHQRMFQVPSEESSDLESQESLKQTTKYMYVEYMQEYIHKQMKTDNEQEPRPVVMLTEPAT